MLIRPFEPADADALAALFHASVREAGLRDYSPAQVAAWSPSQRNPEFYRRQALTRTVLVAVDDSRPIGFGDLEPDGHIDHLYCCPDVTGTGVGFAILGELEAIARRAGIAVLFVEASEGARHLFERRGFILHARRDFMLNGVAIHNYRLAKQIAQA